MVSYFAADWINLRENFYFTLKACYQFYYVFNDALYHFNKHCVDLYKEIKSKRDFHKRICGNFLFYKCHC